MRSSLLAAVLVVVAPACAGGDDLDERLAVEPGGTLEVNLDLGRGLRPDPGFLEIESHSVNEVRIVADTSGWASWNVALKLDREGDTVRLIGGVGGAFSWMFGGPSTRVRIWVPREYSVDVRCTAGPIRIENVHGRVRARAGNAPIEIVGAEGSVRARTEDADVRITEVRGDVRVRADAGDFDLSWIVGAVDARTDDGEIEVEHVEGTIALRTDGGQIDLREVSGHVEAQSERGGIYASFLGAPAGLLETSRGSVVVVMPENRGAELDAISRRGSVSVWEAAALERTTYEQGERVRGAVNGGGELLELYTARGGVRVTRR